MHCCPGHIDSGAKAGEKKRKGAFASSEEACEDTLLCKRHCAQQPSSDQSQVQVLDCPPYVEV